MYITNSRATTKKTKKRSIADMLRKEKKWNHIKCSVKTMRDFPGGTVVKNPPATAGNVGSSSGPGRSHMPWSNEARAPQLLSLCPRACKPQLLSPSATTTEATHLEPMLHNKRSHRNEKPAHRNEE